MPKIILLVEDSEDDIFLMRRALKLARISNPLQVVCNGQQVIDYLDGNGAYADRKIYPLPSVIFMDIKLPHIHGFEVLAWMQQRPEFHDIVTIILTSSPGEKDQERAVELGASGYLVKPPNPKMLVDVFDAIKTLREAVQQTLPATSHTG